MYAHTYICIYIYIIHSMWNLVGDALSFVALLKYVEICVVDLFSNSFALNAR